VKPGSRNALTPIDAAGIAVIAACTFVAYWLGIAPVQRAVIQAAQDREALETATRELSDVETALRESRSQLQKAQALLESNEVRLEPVSHTNARLKLLADMAEEAGLHVSEVTPGSVVTGARFNRVPIRVSGSASYTDVAAFVGRVHAQFRDTAIVQLSLVGRPEEPDAKAQFGLELVWFTSPSTPSR
jgi:Tfp pilus assembly protein PilO